MLSRECSNKGSQVMEHVCSFCLVSREAPSHMSSLFTLFHQPLPLTHLPPLTFPQPSLKFLYWIQLVTHGLCCISSQFLVGKRWQVNKQCSFTQEGEVKSSKSGQHSGAMGNPLLIMPFYPQITREPRAGHFPSLPEAGGG